MGGGGGGLDISPRLSLVAKVKYEILKLSCNCLVSLQGLIFPYKHVYVQ